MQGMPIHSAIFSTLNSRSLNKEAKIQQHYMYAVLKGDSKKFMEIADIDEIKKI
jgi:hypothetical protein